MAVTANAQGRVEGHFTVPQKVPAGSKLVEFLGAGGSKANATFVGRGQITSKEMRQVNTETTIVTSHLEAYDPLAETFTLPAAAFISSADIYICNKGSSGITLVQIRETIAGVPTREVIAECRLPTVSLLTGQYQRFTWAPVRLEAGVEYALVIGCDDANTAVGVAELGKFDPAQQKWVTSQPYTIGVLLASSNGSTWSPYQDRDLCFRINAAPLAATTRIVPLPDVSVTNADELIVLAAVDRPTSDCDVTFTFTLPDNSSFTVSEGERVVLAARLTGTLKWRANLSGSVNATPRLNKDVQLVTASRKLTGTYITRAITAGASSKIRAYYEANTPGSSTATLDVSPDGTTGWAAIPVIAGVTLISDAGVTWIDTTAEKTGYASGNAFVRISLAGNARQRPMLRKFRVVIT